MNDSKQDIDIAVLKEKVENIESVILKIMDNELPHIKKEVVNLKLHLAFYSGGLAVISIILKFFF